MKDTAAKAIKLLQELEHDLSSLMYREIMLTRLRSVLPFDAACCTTVDPLTLLTTGAITEQGLEDIHGRLLDNEYLEDDYNKFTQLAHTPESIRSLWEATTQQPGLSRRYREVLQPAGFGDELRAALKAGDSCWGFLILFRKEDSGPFQPEELELAGSIAPLIGARLRALALDKVAERGDGTPAGEGIIILDESLNPVSLNPGGRRWLEQLQLQERQSAPALPGPVRAVCLQALAAGTPASSGGLPASRLCFRAADGQFMALTASRLEGPSGLVQLAVSFTPAKAADLLPLVSEAYGFTEREQEIIGQLALGRSTKELAQTLYISAYTVQDHLKSIFSKAGVSSRRELIWQLYSKYQ